jgi:hypothetical protein
VRCFASAHYVLKSDIATLKGASFEATVDE